MKQPAQQREAWVEIKIRFKHRILASYDQESADFLFNESSSCSDNLLEGVNAFNEALSAKGDCSCPYTEAKFLGWAD